MSASSAVAGQVLERGARTMQRPTTAARSSLPGPAALRFGRSIGSPTEGQLIGGMHLDEASYLRVVPVYAGADVRWGLQPLVAMLDRAARSVRRQFPTAVTSVGHLSREGGGELDRHRSHESGRDADIAFFVRNASGHQLVASSFVPFRGDGTASSWPGAYFDDGKNWALVTALVSDPEARVTHLFVASPLRARLLAYAERVGAPANVRMRAAEVMQQPRGALPHDDHFHVRIACPSNMMSCVENPSMPPHRAFPAFVARGRRGGSPQDIAHPAGPQRVPPPPAADPRAPPANADPSHGAPPAPWESPGAPVLLPSPLDDVDG
ncbi:MAG: penicillin-insensitive murein endopeptidase [Myxococcota bacterium]|nr:penicillin-insensitive murein endopeptidase [Myxococcota bacterium]